MKSFSRKYLIFFSLFCLVLILAIGAVVIKRPPSNSEDFTERTNPLMKYAIQILETCSSVPSHTACYENEIPKLMDNLSMEETFEVTRLVQERDKNYWYCHALGHRLGAQETAKDPQAWKEAIIRCPTGMCSTGCLHGAFQGRFQAETLSGSDSENLKSELETICKEKSGWIPTPIEQGSCYHALGHLAMYVYAADINKSVSFCEEITQQEGGKNYSSVCFDGSFMQLLQPLDPEELALVEKKQPSKEELNSFCKQFDSEKQASCWKEGWPLFLDEIKTPNGLITFCSTLEDARQQDRCYVSMFYVLTVQFRYDADLLIDFCMNLPEPLSGQCLTSVASRMVETNILLLNKALIICSATDKPHLQQTCYEGLLRYSTLGFHPGSPGSIELCNSLPEPWNSRCRAKTTQGENTPTQ